MLCETANDLFAAEALTLLFQVAAPHFDKLGITAVDLAFSPFHQQSLLDDGNTYQGILQRVAVAQGRHSASPVSVRLKELNALIENGRRQVEECSRKLGPVRIVSGHTLGRLLAADSRNGRIWAGVAVAQTLADIESHKAKFNGALDLMKGIVGTEAGSLLDLVMAQMLQLRTARDELLPAKATRANAVELYMAALGGFPMQSAAASPVFQRVARETDSTSTPMLWAALRGQIADILSAPGPLGADAAADLAFMRRLRVGIAGQPYLAGDETLATAFSRRLKRLLEPHTLNEVLAQQEGMGERLLLLFSLSAEVEDEGARGDLLRIAEHYVDNTDIKATFAAPDVDPGSLATEVIGALLASPLSEYRKGKIRDTLAGLFCITPAQPAAGGPTRSMGGANDAVLFNNERLPLKNWSPVGLVFGPSNLPPAVGEKVTVTVLIRKVELSLGFEAEAEVIRVDKGAIAARYRCADRQIEQRIKGYFSGR